MYPINYYFQAQSFIPSWGDRNQVHSGLCVSGTWVIVDTCTSDRVIIYVIVFYIIIIIIITNTARKLLIIEIKIVG